MRHRIATDRHALAAMRTSLADALLTRTRTSAVIIAVQTGLGAGAYREEDPWQ